MITIPCDHLEEVLEICGRLCSIPDSEFGQTSPFSMAMAEAQSVGSAVSFFLGDCCGVEGDCTDMDAHFFFTAFGKMRTLEGIGSAFYLS